MKRPKIHWTEHEKDTVLDYYLSLDGVTNKERLRKTWNDLYNNNNKFGHFRGEMNVLNYIGKFLRQRNIEIPFAYKNPPNGYHLIPKSKWHYMNKDLQVLNIKTGKFLNNEINNKNVPVIRIKEEDLSFTRSKSRIYVELFLDKNKPYQLKENGIPIQAEKGKIRGIHNRKTKTFNDWIK